MQSVLPIPVFCDSPWHRMDARWKLAGVLLGLILVVGVRSPAGAAVGLGLSVGCLVSARLPWRWWLDRLAGVGLFLVLIVCLLPWHLQAEPGSWLAVRFSPAGMKLAETIFFKALAATALALLLFGTASVETTLHAAAALGTPQAILRIMMVCWRYVQVMHQVVHDFRIALRLRGFRNLPNWQTYRTISQIIGTMLVQGFERAERAAQAMRCRGYQGAIASLEEFRTHWQDPVLTLVLVFCGAAGMILDGIVSRLP
jgi:cobalt/nickel transport system permease protein